MVTPERLDSLQRGFARLLEGYAVTPASAYPLFDRLCAAHEEPHRHYHTLEHVAEVLRVVGRLSPICASPPTVTLAVWFHDAVYFPRRGDNEGRSAELAAGELAALGLDGGTIETVQRLIRATAHLGAEHPAADADTQVLLDADLAILGAARVRYDRYAADIRKEYSYASDADYVRGRVAVLDHFLASPRIYRTPLMFAEGERPARENLAAERERLTAGAAETAG